MLSSADDTFACSAPCCVQDTPTLFHRKLVMKDKESYVED